MVITFEGGKIIATVHEIVVKLDGPHRATMQAQNDAVTLIGKGANVIAVNTSEAKWSIKLDNDQQLENLSDELGIAIQ